MSRVPRPVEDALGRWEQGGLLTAEQRATLRAEAAAHEARSSRRGFQYVLASTGGAVVVIAAGVLADWLWPKLDEGTRALALMAVGFAVHALGLQLEGRARWRPAGYLLQTSGLLVVLGAVGYSSDPWPDMSPIAVAIGLVGHALPILFAVRAAGRDPFMPAVHVALGFAFLAVFLDRATPLSTDQILWVLDGVMLLVALALVVRVRASSGAPGEEWALNAFVAALYVAGVLAVGTAVGPLDSGDDAVWALDVWLAVVTALTLWGIHGAPPAVRRGWFPEQLALCVVFAIPLAFYTTLETLELPAEAAALAVGALGALAMTYGLRREERSVLVAGCLAVLAAAWYYGIDRGGALGAVAALAATAAMLFWLSARLGRRAALREAP